MFCQNCGSAVQGNFCANCGSKASGNSTPYQANAQMPAQPTHSSLCCARCQSHNISVQTITESKSAGCGTIFLYVLLACTICGLFVVIPLMLRKKTETVTYAVCQNCGHRWKR